MIQDSFDFTFSGRISTVAPLHPVVAFGVVIGTAIALACIGMLLARWPSSTHRPWLVVGFVAPVVLSPALAYACSAALAPLLFPGLGIPCFAGANLMFGVPMLAAIAAVPLGARIVPSLLLAVAFVPAALLVLYGIAGRGLSDSMIAASPFEFGVLPTWGAMTLAEIVALGLSYRATRTRAHRGVLVAAGILFAAASAFLCLASFGGGTSGPE